MDFIDYAFDIQTINKLKKLVKEYEDKYADLTFYNEVIKIFNEDSFYHGNIKYYYQKNVNEFDIDYLSGSICINPLDLEKRIKKYTDIGKKLGIVVKDEKTYNVFALCMIVHDVIRVKQFYYAVFSKCRYEEINELYKRMRYDKLKLDNIRKIIYNLKSFEYAFTRNANIEACDVLNDVYLSTDMKEICEKIYLYFLLSGYVDENNKYLSPSQRTLYLLGDKEYLDVPSGEIPFDVALIHGLPIKKSEYKEMYEEIGYKKKIQDIDFEDTIDYIKEYTLR